jgi:hypothetical protein
MSYTEVSTTAGRYYIDYELVDRIIWESALAQQKWIHHEVVETQLESDLWALHIDYPKAYHVRVNSRAAVSLANLSVRANREIHYLRSRVSEHGTTVPVSEMERLCNALYEMQRNGQMATEALLDKQKRMTKRSFASIDSSVKTADRNQDIVRFIRDACAETLLIYAGTLTGGAAYGFAGAGSFIKGYAEYGDTGSVGAGVVQAGASFLTFGLAKGVKVPNTPGGKTMMVYAKVKTEFAGNFAVALLEGKTLQNSLKAATVDTILGAVGSWQGGKMIPKELKNMTPNQMQHFITENLMDIPFPVSCKFLGGGAKSAFLGGEGASDFVKKNMLDPLPKSTDGLPKIVPSAPQIVDWAVRGPVQAYPGVLF